MKAPCDLCFTKGYEKIVPSDHKDALILAVRKDDEIPGTWEAKLDLPKKKKKNESSSKSAKGD